MKNQVDVSLYWHAGKIAGLGIEAKINDHELINSSTRDTTLLDMINF
jgi:hypothetical protein